MFFAQRKIDKAVLCQHGKEREIQGTEVITSDMIKLQKSFLIYIDMLGPSL